MFLLCIVLMYLFFILYCPPYTVGFYGLQFYGDFRRDERPGFLLDSASRLSTASVTSWLGASTACTTLDPGQ